MSLLIPQSTFFYDVSRGKVANMSTVVKFGRNPDVDAGTEDVWQGGGTYVSPTDARIHAVASTSDEDGAGTNTGINQVLIYGLDTNYALSNETLSITGTTPVNTVNSYREIYRMIATGTPGSTGSNVGNITATAATDGTVSAYMAAGKGQTQQAIYRIPANYKAYMHRILASGDGGASALISMELCAIPLGGPLSVKFDFNIRPAGTSAVDFNGEDAFLFEEKTMLKLRCISDSANTIISAAFVLILEPS